MLQTLLEFLSKKTRKTAKHGSWTIIILTECMICSGRSTVCHMHRIIARSCYLHFRPPIARERMIGWYHTGPKLRASDQEINDLFKKFIARPVMVIVDVRPQALGMPTDAYFAVEEIKDVSAGNGIVTQVLTLHVLVKDGTETRKTFLHVPSAIEAEEAEEIGVEHLLRDIKDSTTTTLATRVSEQVASLHGLQSRLSDVQKYLVEMAAGRVPVNHQIVYHLQDALNLLPDLSDTVTTQSFASSTNDSMLVVYLSSLLRAVIALHALVDNKATIGKAEVDEGEKKDKEKDNKDNKGKEQEAKKEDLDSSSKAADAKKADK